eukprot:UN31751
MSLTASFVGGDNNDGMADTTLGKFLNNEVSNQHALTEKQMEEIKRIEVESQKLVGDKKNLTNMAAEYKDNAKFLTKIKSLMKTHSEYRPVRGDGSCFYRAYFASICEQYNNNILSEKEFHNIVEISRSAPKDLVKKGFPSFTIEDFFETFEEELIKIQKDKKSYFTGLRDSGIGMYFITCLRYITSLHLRNNEMIFLPYVMPLTVEIFCRNEVEPSYKEADQVQCIALSQALNVPIRIYYL